MEGQYTLGIVGARTFTEYHQLERALGGIILEYGLPKKVVSGGLRGANRLAIMWAINMGIPIVNHKLNWNKNGKSAEYVRNLKIVEDSSLLLAFPSCAGKETQRIIKTAQELQTPCVIITDWES